MQRTSPIKVIKRKEVALFRDTILLAEYFGNRAYFKECPCYREYWTVSRNIVELPAFAIHPPAQ